MATLLEVGEQNSNLRSSTAEPTLLAIMWYIHLLIILQGCYNFHNLSGLISRMGTQWCLATTVFISGAYRQVDSPCLPSDLGTGHHKTFAMMDIDLPLVVHLGKTSSNRKLGQRDNWDWDRGKWNPQAEGTASAKAQKWECIWKNSQASTLEAVCLHATVQLIQLKL